MQWTSRARTRGGRSYENGCIGVFTVADGQIQQVREYMDTLYARDVAFGDGGDYVQPSPADTSTAVSSIRSTAARAVVAPGDEAHLQGSRWAQGHPPELVRAAPGARTRR